MLLDINNPGDHYTQFLGLGALNLDGTINLDLRDVSLIGASWTLVDPGLAEDYGPAFSLHSLDGGVFTGNGDVFSYVDGQDRTWRFTESTGVLMLVPEPATWLLVAIALLGMPVYALRNRNRKS